MVTDSSFLTQAFMHSGKFFNELGNYDVCSDPQNDYVYALAVIRPDLQAIVQYNNLLWGFCIPKDCNSSGLEALNDLFIMAATSYVNKDNLSI